MMDFELLKTIGQMLRLSNICGAITHLEELLAAERCDRFSGLIGAQFTNPPEQVLVYTNQFISDNEQRFPVEAVYLEMNGFDINYDGWDFSPFGYATYYVDVDECEWLPDWQSEEMTPMLLTGFEAIQDDFAWYYEERDENDQSYHRAYVVAVILLMVKFIALVQAALASGQLVKAIPILATAHDFCVFGRFMPVIRS